jgi:hypothetical protein
MKPRCEKVLAQITEIALNWRPRQRTAPIIQPALASDGLQAMRTFTLLSHCRLLIDKKDS